MRFAVEEGHVLAFARAIGDETALASRTVPPTFTATTVQHDPEHMRGMHPVGALAIEPPPGQSLLHAEQHFEYLAPIGIGDVLTVTESQGASWTKQNRQGGVLTFTELIKELRDDAGALVVRSRMVLVSTAVTT
jgi:hypothetical protein